MKRMLVCAALAMGIATAVPVTASAWHGGGGWRGGGWGGGWGRGIGLGIGLGLGAGYYGAYTGYYGGYPGYYGAYAGMAAMAVACAGCGGPTGTKSTSATDAANDKTRLPAGLVQAHFHSRTSTKWPAMAAAAAMAGDTRWVRPL